MTLAQALRQAQALGLERLDAQWLLLALLGRPAQDRAWLLAHDEQTLPEPAAERWPGLIAQRSQGVPLAYLTGHKAFYGLDLQVDARVLDPRADTETLVEWALERVQELTSPTVLDLGTGPPLPPSTSQRQRCQRRRAGGGPGQRRAVGPARAVCPGTLADALVWPTL